MMNSPKCSDELVAALQAFRIEHDLAITWHSELLLLMAPLDDSKARACAFLSNQAIGEPASVNPVEALATEID